MSSTTTMHTYTPRTPGTQWIVPRNGYVAVAAMHSSSDSVTSYNKHNAKAAPRKTGQLFETCAPHPCLGLS